ncbi:hypothetical protein [Halotia branconii]|uniref:Uncharacterized protein n=1 Tax=Halotia branconii CENA392 TaxID=1539056 RepID=A0AAJ6NSD5_9CYAN|nr:hypothetical protein [Halotia branconii]WGV23468.1 hypothetical protein QI031_16720 [Halotia branconii CENA392]WGV25673.1 hypothetical protein QI031_28800 [Halotia branconii CENA392]WGV25931.1 hypothetical protein QI031_30205 [Halotia branconii CENA392]WGV25947.1 hypothetical protein QI031_00015 [Halotia branconii CENA392]
MTQCFRFYGKGADGNVSYEFFACGTTPEYRARNSTTVYLYLDGVNVAGTNYFYLTTTAQVTAVANDNPNAGYTKYGNCTACNAVPYDCINNSCVKSNVYGTPGEYDSLAECQAGCGMVSGQTCPDPFKCLDPNNYCPPDMVCIEQAEFNEIRRLLR